MSLQHLEELATHFIRLIKGRIRLFSLEFNLAKISVIPFLLLSVCIFILVITTWLILLTVIAYSIYSCSHNIFSSLLSILLLNVILTGVIAFSLNQVFKNMRFSRTRKHFKKNHQESNNVSKKTTESPD